MKKVNIDMMLGKKTKCLYRKPMPKPVILHSYLPATKATKGAVVGSLLARFGIDSELVYEEFNKRTKNWMVGIQIPVALTVNTGKTYLMEIKTPEVYPLINTIWKFDSKKTGVLEISKEEILGSLYKIAIIKSEDDLSETTLKRWVAQLLGTFTTYRAFSYRRRFQKKKNYKKKK